MCSQIEFKMSVYFGNYKNKEAKLMNQFIHICYHINHKGVLRHNFLTKLYIQMPYKWWYNLDAGFTNKGMHDQNIYFLM